MDSLASEYPGWTPYHYVLNNPLLFTDPTGMYAECPEDCEFFTKAFNYLRGYEMGENDFNQKQFTQLVYEGAQEKAAYEAENMARESLSTVKKGSDLGSDASYTLAAASAVTTFGTGGASSKVTVPLTGAALQSGFVFEGVGTAASGLEVILFQDDPSEFIGRTGSFFMGAGIMEAYNKKAGAVLNYLSTSTQATRRVSPSFRLRSATHAAADATGVATTNHINRHLK